MNEVVDGEDFNILSYRNFYNGGGVAIGDINNDSLPDLYFTSNQQKSTLLNKEIFTSKTSLKRQEWVAVWSEHGGDNGRCVNADGWMDIMSAIQVMSKATEKK